MGAEIPIIGKNGENRDGPVCLVLVGFMLDVCKYSRPIAAALPSRRRSKGLMVQ